MDSTRNKRASQTIVGVAKGFRKLESKTYLAFNLSLAMAMRVRNRKISKRVNKTGRHKSVAAPPEELLERYCPHLAFIEPARYDLLIKMLDEKNAKYRRKGTGGIDPRKNVSKKRTIWPGQHIECAVCGRLFQNGSKPVAKTKH